jgi:hypothetical protein
MVDMLADVKSGKLSKAAQVTSYYDRGTFNALLNRLLIRWENDDSVTLSTFTDDQIIQYTTPEYAKSYARATQKPKDKHESIRCTK